MASKELTVRTGRMGQEPIHFLGPARRKLLRAVIFRRWVIQRSLMMTNKNVATSTKPETDHLIATAGDFFSSLPLTGLENVTNADLLIPRLTILQSLSPQLNRKKPEFIEGAQAGQFCDTGTGEVFDRLEVLPVYFAKVYLEWAPDRSGMIKNWGTNRTALEGTRQDEIMRNIRSNGNIVSETMTFYVLNLTVGGRRSFIPLSSTQIKAGKSWLTQIMTRPRIPGSGGRMIESPIFYWSWIAMVNEQSNKKGDWFGWSFKPGREDIRKIDPSGDLLKEAVAFAQDARDGLVIGDVGVEEHDSGSGEAPF